MIGFIVVLVLIIVGVATIAYYEGVAVGEDNITKKMWSKVSSEMSVTKKKRGRPKGSKNSK